jgi:hypothetical protein
MSVANDWWQSFYAGSYLAFHRDAIQSKDTLAEVDQIIKVLRISPPRAGYKLIFSSSWGFSAYQSQY